MPTPNVIYVGRSVTVGTVTTNDIVRLNDGALTLLGTFTSPCKKIDPDTNLVVTTATKGLAISGVLLVSCEATSPSSGSTRTPAWVWESTAR